MPKHDTATVTYPDPPSSAKYQCALQLRGSGQDFLCLSLSYFSLTTPGQYVIYIMLFNGATRETPWIYRSNNTACHARVWDYGHRQKLAAEHPLTGQAVRNALSRFHHSSDHACQATPLPHLSCGRMLVPASTLAFGVSSFRYIAPDKVCQWHCL